MCFFGDKKRISYPLFVAQRRKAQRIITLSAEDHKVTSIFFGGLFGFYYRFIILLTTPIIVYCCHFSVGLVFCVGDGQIFVLQIDASFAIVSSLSTQFAKGIPDELLTPQQASSIQLYFMVDIDMFVSASRC